MGQVMASVGGERKSRNSKIRGIDKTFRTGRSVVEEKKKESSKKVTSSEIK